MKRSIIIAAALALAAGTCSPTIEAPEIEKRVADLGPLPVVPAPPDVDAEATGGLVGFEPEEALALHNYMTRVVPNWAARARAMYAFYRCQAVECEESAEGQ